MEELIRRAEEKGINVEDLIISALSKLDPQEGIRIRLELAGKFLSETKEYLEKGDLVQASEKAYKVAEEIVKALAEKFNLPEYEQALREGRWYTYALGTAAAKLSLRLGDWVRNGWDSAYVLYAWGFHEGKFDVQSVKARFQDVERMLEEARKIIQ